ncbi:DUF4251 domain-containing protein [Maribacter cobaltidurans]|uniref:DUF4251 domain-containing protein n=1 Tax=Maribacter cobaltidurans TaxID=1178778 RepID=A0A223V9L9_9FLAO|nr:DUF4251 domain-containing protein [Maribacter cobaltidurans]ASV32081.1 hypothetical protein CJ263_18690 [Maribacter cobaltidurans]
MKTCLHIVCSLSLLFLLGCKTSSKVSYTSQQITEFKDFMNAKSFEFIATTANPLPGRGMMAVANSGLLPPGSTMSNIQLQGTSNYLRVEGDTISAFLPYYGERQSGGGYTSDAGIVFDGIPSNYKEEYDAQKNEMQITFSISEKSETYQVSLNLFPNKKATVVVTSSQRFSIRYFGNIKEIEDAENPS